MTKKNIVTVITDHQLTADTIATALGATNKCAGYYLGNGYAVTWTNGSIIEAEFVPNKSFLLASGMDPRLVFANNFKFAMRNYDHLVGYKKSEQDERQLDVIEALIALSDTVVNAMAPSVEAELDFLSLRYYLGFTTTVRRAWLPQLTKTAIINAVENGPSRPEKYEQWLSDSVYNKLISMCEEDAALRGDTVIEEMPVTQAAAEAAALGVDAPEAGEKAELDIYALHFTDGITLLNLPQLLVAGAVELDFTHEKTMQTAFVLYAKKLISYPFGQQNTVPYDVWKQMCHNRDVLRYNSKWGKTVKRCFLSKRHNYRSGENEFNGYGIVTTGLHPTDLTHDEEKLYNLIVKRVLDAFTPVKKRRDKKTRKAQSK